MRHVANANQIKTLGNIYTLIAQAAGRDRERERMVWLNLRPVFLYACVFVFSLSSAFFETLLLFYDSQMPAPAFFSRTQDTNGLSLGSDEGGRKMPKAGYTTYDMHKNRDRGR